MAEPLRPAVGLDLGTTQVRVVVLETDHGSRRVIGVGGAASEGIRRGVVVDVDKTVTAIRAALAEAEATAGTEIGEVTVGITGTHLAGLDSTGAVPITGAAGVTAADRRAAVDAARTVAIPFDREVLHVLPQAFAVDGQRRLREPLGMTGVRLEAQVHILTGAVTSVRNVSRCVERAGLVCRDLVVAPLAASRALLSEEDREIGVCLVDVGAGTTGVSLYRDGALRRLAVLGVGGHSVTNDISVCLRTTWAQAEWLQRKHADTTDDAETGPITVPGADGRHAIDVDGAQLQEVVGARLQEIFALARGALDEPLGRLPAGILLTGRGAGIPGAAELAEEAFDTAARLAAPEGFHGIGERTHEPGCATAVGLAHLAADAAARSGPRSPTAWAGLATAGPATAEAVLTSDAIGTARGADVGAVARMKDWLSQLL